MSEIILPYGMGKTYDKKQKRIESLTPEQEALMPYWVDKWTKVGLSCEPADFEKAQEGILKCYEFAQLEKPKHFQKVSSPIVGAIAAPLSAYILAFADENNKSIIDKIYDVEKDEENPYQFLRDLPDVKEGVYAAVCDIVGVRLNARYNIKNQFDIIDNSGVARLVNGAGREVLNQLLRNEETRNELKQAVQEMWYWNIGGQFWCAWQAFVTYFLDVCGWETELEPRIRAYEQAQSHIGWWWPFQEFCVMTDRPHHIHVDEQNRLHSTEESAIGWRDSEGGGNGWGMYVVNGINVPEDIIKDKSSITVERIHNEQNAELRRIMMDLYGHARFMKDANGEVTAEDEYGKIWECKIPGGNARNGDDRFVLVEVLNSTPEPDPGPNGEFPYYKTYWLPVHPEGRPMLSNGTLGNPQKKTPRNYIASTFGLTGDQYAPLQQT